jgi:putative endonuclease
MWTLYIIECQDGKFYTGITEDLKRRLKEHTRNGSHFTSYNPAIKLLFAEEHHNKMEAQRREVQIKRWSRAKKIALARGNREELRKLSRSRD